MADNLPSGWQMRMSRSKNAPYYINEHTGQSQWEKPNAPAERPAQSQVQVLHLLVKHNQSRNPKSWRQPEGISKGKNEAIEELEAYRQQIVNESSSVGLEKAFRNLAGRISDCSSAQRGGDLGLFSRGQMQKPFEEVSFSLNVGELSGVVDTNSGVHIILRLQ